MLLQVYYLRIFNTLLSWKNPKEREASLEKLSIIICAKNEISNLKVNLPKLLKRNPKVSEIIVVDDFSTDGTSAFLSGLKADHKKLKSIVPEKDIAGKKMALDAGIREASGEFILLTDADCQPKENWAETMSKILIGKTEVVLGYGPYFKEDSWLNKWQRWECFFTALQYLSFALRQKAYMGVGRNLMYKKKLYLDKADPSKHFWLSSGDDDLNLQQMINSDNVAISLNRDSFVYSKSASNLSDYINQKKRHYSTAQSYKAEHKLRLAGISIAHVLFFCCFLSLIFAGQYVLALSVYILRCLIYVVHFKRLNKIFGEEDLVRYWPILDIIQLCYYIYFSAAVLFPKNQTWKQR